MAILKRDQIPTLVVIALALAAGLLMVALTGAERSNFVDSEDYIATAQMILHQGRYPDVGTLPFFRAPLYPLFLTGIWSIFGESFLIVKLFQVLLHAASAFFVMRTAEVVSRNRGVAVIAGVLFAVNPYFAFNAVSIQTEVVHTFLITFGLFTIARQLFAENISIGSAIQMGVAFGFAALCKPSALGVCFVFAAVLLFTRFRERAAWLATCASVAAMFLIILPWSFYNLATKGEFILINDASGWVLWAGNVPESLPIYVGDFPTPQAAIDYQNYVGRTLSNQQIAEFENTTGYSALSFKQREALWRAKAFEIMAADPTLTMKLFALKFYMYWKPFISGEVYSPLQVTMSVVFGIPLFLLGFWGVFTRLTDSGTKPFLWLFAAVALFTTAVHVVIVSGIRLRLPYIDPFLTVFAAIALSAMFCRVASRYKWLDLGKFFNGDRQLFGQVA